MEPYRLFQFCPRCGQRQTAEPAHPFRCAACGLLYFFNPAVAVGAILLGPDDRALFVKRAHDPAKGKLGLPGGFVDLGETAEDALRREVREEVNLESDSLEFLCSCPNSYLYAGITYPVCDLYFVARASRVKEVAALDGVESYCWLKPSDVDLDELAFPSAREAIRLYNSQKK
jgi:NAD+ diphosphatase